MSHRIAAHVFDVSAWACFVAAAYLWWSLPGALLTAGVWLALLAYANAKKGKDA